MLFSPAVKSTGNISLFRGAGNLSTDGSWKVVGNAGALAVHAVPFSNDLVLFMQRPNNLNGSGDDPYLIVRSISSEAFKRINFCTTGIGKY